jgi:two-component system chemotaxis sensor kinase CheA
VDLAKYRTLFLEEASDHLAEMSRALLDLEKDPASGEAIDLVFRMAHSIKGMASSLGYDAITEVAHRLEDRMAVYRREGRVAAGEGIGILFRGLEGLERMVEVVRESGEPPGPDPSLAALLGPEGMEAEAGPARPEAPAEAAPAPGDGLKKKL